MVFDEMPARTSFHDQEIRKDISDAARTSVDKRRSSMAVGLDQAKAM